MYSGIIVFIIFALFCLYTTAVWPENSRRERMLAFSRRYVAHRGLYDNKGAAPENSMAAFRLAVERGYGIETDVQMSADGQLVIMHDYDLKRAAGCDRKVTDCSYREMKGFTLFASQEHIPLFWNFLKEVGGRVPIIVEIKLEGKKGCDELCREVAYCLDQYEGLACIESFNPLCLRWFKKNHPQMLRGQLSGNYRRAHWGGGFFNFTLTACMFNFLTRPDFIAYRLEDAHTWPFRFLRNFCRACTVAWTVRSEDDLEEAGKNYDVFIFENFEPSKDAAGKTVKPVSAEKKGDPMLGVVRRHMILSGMVQGVGFRYRATYIAEAVGIAGWVKNLYDDRVEMEVQGTEEQIREMMRKLNEQRYIVIDNVESEDIPVVKDDYEFKVRY